MLQGLNLPFFDITTPESGAGIAITPPAEGDMPVLRFADIFRLEPTGLAVPGAGISLPLPGNDLPSADVESATESALPAEAMSIFWAGSLPASPVAPDSVSLSVLTAGTAPANAAPANLMPTNIEAMSPAPAAPLPPALVAASTAPAISSSNQPDAGIVLPRLPADAAVAAAGPEPLATPVVTQSLSARASGKPPVIVSDVGAARARPAPGTELADEQVELPPSAADDTNRSQKPPLKAPQFAPATQASPLPGAANNQELSQLAQLSQSSTLQNLQPTPAPVRADTAAAVAAVLPQLATPVQDPAWGDQLGDRLLMMAADKLQFAEIRLSPAELGPLRIRVSIDDGAASVTFHAQHAITRDALEQAMPRLRELLADNGLTLAEGRIANSGEQGVPQGKPEQHATPQPAAALAADIDDEPVPELATDRFSTRPRPDQLLDTFA